MLLQTKIKEMLEPYKIDPLEPRVGFDYLWVRIDNEDNYRVQTVTCVSPKMILIKNVHYSKTTTGLQWVRARETFNLKSEYLYSLAALPKVAEILTLLSI